MAHVLVVGGTGILEKVSLFLASHDNVVSVVARSPEEFQTLTEKAAGLKGRINPILVDYEEVDALSQSIRNSIDMFGPVTLTVNWIQEKVLKAMEVIAGILNATSPICRSFQVLPGEELASMKAKKYFETLFRNLERVLYRIIVLGFKKEKGENRMLSNDEITDGIINALRDDTKEAVIGNDPFTDVAIA